MNSAFASFHTPLVANLHRWELGLRYQASAWMHHERLLVIYRTLLPSLLGYLHTNAKEHFQDCISDSWYFRDLPQCTVGIESGVNSTFGQCIFPVQRPAMSC